MTDSRHISAMSLSPEFCSLAYSTEVKVKYVKGRPRIQCHWAICHEQHLYAHAHTPFAHRQVEQKQVMNSISSAKWLQCEPECESVTEWLNTSRLEPCQCHCQWWVKAEATDWSHHGQWWTMMKGGSEQRTELECGQWAGEQWPGNTVKVCHATQILGPGELLSANASAHCTGAKELLAHTSHTCTQHSEQSSWIVRSAYLLLLYQPDQICVCLVESLSAFYH